MMSLKTLRTTALSATIAATLALAPALIPTPAFAWRAVNGTEVNPVRKGVFEVIPHGRSGAQQFWCGAGDYARVALGIGPTQRLYIWRAIGPSETRPGSKSVQFALSPPPGKEDYKPGYSLSVKAEGDNLDVFTAQRYCGSGLPF